ncbi:MAG: hypothetical protein Q9227_000219 [Pyrenula ochraceoflavens]
MGVAQDSQGRGVSQLLDSFFHIGPNGCHQCLVFELCGPSGHSIIDDSFEDDDLRRDMEENLFTLIQLLEATRFIHEADYAHGEWSGWPCDEDNDDDDNIRVIDLGHAFPFDSPPTKLPQPSGLQAPETIFTTAVDFRVDLWRIGQIIYYLTFGHYPFGAFEIAGVVCSMIELLGDIPPEWQSQWEQMKLDAKHCKKSLEILGTTKPRLDQLIGDQSLDKDTRELLRVAKNLLRYRPEDRMTASEALKTVRDIYERVQSSSEYEDHGK